MVFQTLQTMQHEVMYVFSELKSEPQVINGIKFINFLYYRVQTVFHTLTFARSREKW